MKAFASALIATVAVAQTSFNGSKVVYDGNTATGITASPLFFWMADLSSLFPCSYSFDEKHTWSSHIATYKATEDAAVRESAIQAILNAVYAAEFSGIQLPMFPSGANVVNDVVIDSGDDWSWSMGECNALTHAFLDQLDSFATMDRVTRNGGGDVKWYYATSANCAVEVTDDCYCEGGYFAGSCDLYRCNGNAASDFSKMSVLMTPAFVNDNLQDSNVTYPAVENFLEFYDAHTNLFLNNWNYSDCNIRAGAQGVQLYWMDKEEGNFWNATCTELSGEDCVSYSMSVSDELSAHNAAWEELSTRGNDAGNLFAYGQTQSTSTYLMFGPITDV